MYVKTERAPMASGGVAITDAKQGTASFDYDLRANMFDDEPVDGRGDGGSQLRLQG